MRTFFGLAMLAILAWAMAQALVVGVDHEIARQDAEIVARKAAVSHRATNLETQSRATFYVAP